MSMTVVNARIYVARIIGGGAASQETLDMASEAILRGYQDFQNKRFWMFLLKDTSNTTVVSGVTATSASAVVNAPSAGTFDFINVGQTVTISASDTATLAAGTTVSTVTRGTDGVVTSITLSNSFGGTTDTSSTLTFSADIPVRAGTNDYALPTDFVAPYTARITTNPRTLQWKDQRYWDRVITDQTVRGTPNEYTTYNAYSELTQNFGTPRLKFDRIPDVNDTLALRYYRRFNPSGTYVDMPDEYLYQFLDYCANILLLRKRATDNPTAFSQSTSAALESAVQDDDERTDDNDTEQYMKSGWEMGDWNRPLWGNGGFDPFRF